METTDMHTSEETPAPEARDARRPDTYERPSVAELGSFRDLTAGTGGGAGPDEVDSLSGV
jgi:hypothetical protein